MSAHRLYGVQEIEMRNLMMVLFALTLSNVAMAQDALVLRQDARRDADPSYAVGVVTPDLEVWAFALPDFPLLEVGRTTFVPLGERSSVLVGGYLSWWEKTDQFYLEPWSLWRHQAGDFQLSAKLAAYMPLNGGAWMAYSDQTSLTYRLGKGIDAGLAADWWLTEGAKPSTGLGAVLNVGLGDHARFSLRALKGFNEPDSIRWEVTLF